MKRGSDVIFSTVSGCLIASIQGDMTVESLQLLSTRLLAELADNGQRTLLLDLSSIELLDLADFDALRKMLSAVHLLGVKAVLIGFQAGLAALLVTLGANTRGLRVAATLEQALAVYGHKVPTETAGAPSGPPI